MPRKYTPEEAAAAKIRKKPHMLEYQRDYIKNKRTPAQREAIKAYGRNYSNRRRAAETDEQRSIRRMAYKSWRTRPDVAAQQARAARKSVLRRRYGMTLDQHEQMLENQNGRCLICGIHENDLANKDKRTNRLQIDHCHVTGKVRALLCAPCNKILGLANDEPELLFALACFAQTHAAQGSNG